MKKTDDIDLFLTLHPHGWSTCWIYVDDRKIELTITHVLGDPYVDLMRAVTQLLDKAKETMFFFYGETGGERIGIKRIMDRQHMLNVKVDGFYETYGEQIKDFEETIEFEIKERSLVTMVYFQLKKIETLLIDKSYASTRGNNFPFNEFRMFEKRIKSYLQMEKEHNNTYMPELFSGLR